MVRVPRIVFSVLFDLKHASAVSTRPNALQKSDCSGGAYPQSLSRANFCTSNKIHSSLSEMQDDARST